VTLFEREGGIFPSLKRSESVRRHLSDLHDFPPCQYHKKQNSIKGFVSSQAVHGHEDFKGDYILDRKTCSYSQDKFNVMVMKSSTPIPVPLPSRKPTPRVKRDYSSDDSEEEEKLICRPWRETARENHLKGLPVYATPEVEEIFPFSFE
jgi:hypothetical protein